ncbi:acylphosphatase [Candidatus Marinamargulisbacteria bacterium SCGC AG-439-L15]|nr:acylphosphatase [Candidatus Marinamargulisbacteria bacterium SCGC AG-439-L15]
MNKQQVRVKIYGQVQGVFFRAFTQEKAKELALTGWVKNKDDGSVEAVFQGAPKILHQMLDWCKEGSPHSTVDSLHPEWEGLDTVFDEFEIRY